MGFFSKLFGGDDEVAAAATATSEYLNTAAARAGVFDAKVEAVDGGATELTGSLRGLPFYIRAENQGEISDLVVRHARIDRDDIDLAVVAESTDITGKEDRAFLALAAPLQRRVLDALRSTRIRELSADETEVELCFLVPRPDCLSEDLVLAVDIALARGATKPTDDDDDAGDDDDDDDGDSDGDVDDDADGDDDDDDTDAATAAPGSRPADDAGAAATGDVRDPEERRKQQHGAAIAAKLAAQIPGARIVDCPAFDSIDVRWSIDATPVRIVCDWGFNDLDIEVHCIGTGVNFELEIVDADSLDLLDVAAADPEWDDAEGHYPIAHGTYVHGSRRRVLRQDKLLRKLDPAVLETLARELADDGLDWVHLDEDEVLRSTLCELTDATDARLARAISLASLYAKVAAGLVK